PRPPGGSLGGAGRLRRGRWRRWGRLRLGCRGDAERTAMRRQRARREVILVSGGQRAERSGGLRLRTLVVGEQEGAEGTKGERPGDQEHGAAALHRANPTRDRRRVDKAVEMVSERS